MAQGRTKTMNNDEIAAARGASATKAPKEQTPMDDIGQQIWSLKERIMETSNDLRRVSNRLNPLDQPTDADSNSPVVSGHLSVYRAAISAANSELDDLQALVSGLSQQI